jgi:multidrug efflux pump subunit AcrA (membrane-fusion protein)
MFSAIVRYTTILGAVAGVVAMAAVMRKQGDNELPQADAPPVAPAAKPFLHAVAATGILEALSENVAVGVPAPGLVMEVMVQVNDAIEAGQPLFRVDDRELQAEKINQQALLEVTRAELAVRDAFMEKAKRQLDRLQSLGDSQAISREQLDAAEDDMAIATAQLAAARSQVAAAEAAIQRLDTLIGRLTMKAPRAGTVLQVNIRAGEYAATSPRSPAMVIGDTGKLQVRADIDEQNATRIRPGQKAVATLKGDPRVSMPLEFLRVEPYIIPKVSLTGASTERVDTRVLQVMFSLQRPADTPVYVGQQVDVLIEAPER